MSSLQSTPINNKHNSILKICDAYKIVILNHLYKDKGVRYYRRYYHFNIECRLTTESREGYTIYNLNTLKYGTPFELVTCRKEALVEKYENEKFYHSIYNNYKKHFKEDPLTFDIETVLHFECESEIKELEESEIKSYPQLIESLTKKELDLIEWDFLEELIPYSINRD